MFESDVYAFLICDSQISWSMVSKDRNHCLCTFWWPPFHPFPLKGTPWEWVLIMVGLSHPGYAPNGIICQGAGLSLPQTSQFLFPWKQLSPKSLTPEITKIRGPYYHKTILTHWGPLGGRRGGQELHGSSSQLQPLEMLRGTRNLVFISSKCEESCRSEWTFDSGWQWNLSRTQRVLFCFVFFIENGSGPSSLYLPKLRRNWATPQPLDF